MVSAGFRGNVCAVTGIYDGNQITYWGRNENDLLDVPELVNPESVSVGNAFTCAIDSSGLQCWGDNQKGQTQVPVLANSVQVSSVNHSCALGDEGIVCWGPNDFGESSPPDMKNPSQVSVGAMHSCAIAEGEVVCWGRNIDFANEQGDSDFFVPTALLAEVGTVSLEMVRPLEVSVGYEHSCALDESGITCWGRNNQGQTNVGKLIESRQIAVGGNHSCAEDKTGLVCWGYQGRESPEASVLGDSR